MSTRPLESLLDALWSDADVATYWLVDGAQDPTISQRIRHGSLKFWCLYSGELTPRLRAAAPYLVQLVPGHPQTLELLTSGWGRAWGILLNVPVSLTMSQLRLHLKKRLHVQTEEGKLLMFRFYDPRVLSIYLPTCTEEELADFFGPVDRMFVEMHEGTQWRVFEKPLRAVEAQSSSLSSPSSSSSCSLSEST